MGIPDRYESGPDATVRAAASAHERLDGARGVVLAEGVSDQIAVEVAAGVLGVGLDRVVVMPIGGAHAIGRVLNERFERVLARTAVAVLCDRAEAAYVDRAIAASRRDGVAVFVCEADLEDELIRAAGRPLLERLLDDEGDAASFARMSAQPAWRGAPQDARFRRFVGAGAGRKCRYAAAIVSALAPDRLPAPLANALGHVSG